MQLDLFAPVAPKHDRGAALHAVDDLADAINSAMLEAGLYAYSGSWDAGLVINPDAPESRGAGVDPEAHARQWPATWHICGHRPDALFVEVRPRTGQRLSGTVKAVLEVMANVPGANARLESEQHPAPYHSYGMWRWGDGWIATEDPEARKAAA
ncbi:hypothetical protein SIDU_05900 [Sphingobium indicum B90A]|uniref:Uncharacterized protein n=2 Tax=Sphingobium indicum TaxID=332055 RepID=A0A1L5BMS6_SPHIB|nr:hypothetical protein SIDU_05900 [Sphingobium indicum B90A]